MKKRLFFLVFIMIWAVVGLAQNNKISYQAVVRNSQNQLVYDQNLTVTVSLANSDGGTVVYAETHAVTSNANGLISLLIGDGTPVTGSNWDAIQWNSAWVTAEISQGGTVLATHNLPLSAVPYALYADQVNPVALANYLTTNHYLTDEVQVLSISHDTVFLTGGSFVKLPAGFSGDYNDLTNLPDLTQYATNAHLNDTINAYYDTTHMKTAIHDTADVLRSMMNAAANDAKITLQKNGINLDFFTVNQATDQSINIPIPTTVAELTDASDYVTQTQLNSTLEHYTTTNQIDTLLGDYATKDTLKNYLTIGGLCDSLAECVLIKTILDRLDKLEHLNDSLANELDKLKPALTLTASHDTVTVCEGSTKPVTYTATFHNCSSSDYVISWKVNGVDSSNVTGTTLTFNAETAGNYKVACIATRSGNVTVTDTVTTTVIVDTDIPSFTATVSNLTVDLSNVLNTVTIQWDTDSLPVAFSGTSATHVYSVATTVTITATNAGGCTYTEEVILQPIAPEVTTDSIPTGTIAGTTAIAYGTVTSDGGMANTRRGMVFSTSNSNLKLGAAGVDSVMNGTGIGSFACNLKRLTPCTQYYVRAFAINEVDTVYGAELNFTTPTFTCGSTLTDIDGNDYETLLLGSQCWMKQNLRVSHYANGDTILLSTSTVGTTSPYRYEPDSNLTTYGYLYNWYAAMGGSSSSASNPSNVQGVCPNGWHLPSDAEWTQLTNFVASYNNGVYVCGNDPANIGKSMVSQQGWPVIPGEGCNIGNTIATNNSTQFSIPSSGTWDCGGGIGTSGIGYTNNGHAIFLSATENDDPTYTVYCREFYYMESIAEKTAPHKTFGRSVRCVLDCATGHTYLPTVSAVKITNTGGTLSMAANVDADGGAEVTARGVCWSTSPHPTTSSGHTASGSGIGAFSVTPTLAPGATYYVRAYAINSVGTTYGAEITFVMPNRPTVTTAAATDITASTATTGGNVTADGGATVTDRGVCWSTSPNPTIADSYTSDGTGTGVFSSSLDNLTGGTTYHVRAYATNNVGTAYGEDVSFTTLNRSLNITSDKPATFKMCGASSQTVTYTATPSYGDAGDYTYSWSCSGGTISGTPTSNTATITYTSAATYTVSCTATHNTESFDVSKTASTTIQSGGYAIYLGMCSEGLTINSNEEINKKNYRFSYVGSISWGDGTSSTISNEQFSHTYATPGIYNVTVTSGSSYGNCEVTQTFAMGDIVTHPCNVANPHTNTSTYTSSTGGLETTNSEGKVTTVADIDGHTYNVVGIGSQCWMAENLRTTVKPDGTAIAQGSSSTSSDASTAYWYEPAGGVSADQYGYLYNWTAVMNGESASSTNPSNVRGICPLGWHVPSSAEWDAMLSEVGTNNAGTLATGCGWKPDYNIDATAAPTKKTPGDYTYPERNFNGFGALGTQLNYENYFINAYFWTSTAGSYADYYRISYNSNTVSRSNGSMYSAYALRCVRD